MILVHMPQSYPEISQPWVKGETDHGEALARLAEKTLGRWARIKDLSLERYAMPGDVVAGVYKGVIVTAYRQTGWSRGDDGRVTFEGHADDALAWMIGCDAPGGAWVRGAAYPVRCVNWADFAAEHEGARSLDGSDGSVENAMLALMGKVRAVPEPERRKPANPSGSDLLDQVEVTLNPRGGIIVSVPATTRVQIVPR